MAHERIRYLTEKYFELLGFSPLIGLLGHRQVGKTTFLEKNAKHYLTFDDLDVMREAKNNSKKFINSITRPHTAIDESQLVEEIFPALKERVRLNKRPGQIILPGSVRFTSKKSIRESLTGRIQYLELLPMTISELQGEPQPHKLDEILSTQHLPALLEKLNLSTQSMKKGEKEIEHYLINGGLPGICFIRKDQTRNDKILDQMKTILDRDLRQIYSTQLTFSVLIEFLTEIAINEGRPFHYQHYKRITGLSPITQQKLIYALEAIFLIRRIPIEGDQRSFSYVLEDQAESRFLAKSTQTLETQYLHLLYRNLRAEYFYDTTQSIEHFQFITKGNKNVRLAFRSEKASVGFIFTKSDKISRDLKGTAASFLKRYANSKIIFVSNGRKLNVIDERSILCPISCLI